MKSKKGLIFGILGLVIFFGIGLFAPAGMKDTVASFIGQDFRIAIPLALAAVGMVYGERSGILNLGTDGLMLTGAMFTWLGAAMFGGSPWIGSLFGIVSTVIIAGLFAFLVITIRANQTVIGVSINILALGITSTVYRAVGSELPSTKTDNFPIINFDPILGKIPVIGNYLSDILTQHVFIFIGIAIVLLLQFHLFKTNLGLNVRAVGEYPKACDTLGINVFKIRYGSVLFSGVLAGLAGGLLVLDSGSFVENFTSGKGFIAIAAVIFGKYTPIGALGAALIFGGAQALQYSIPTSWGMSSDLLSMIPYIITVVALAGFIGKTNKPAASTIPYTKE